jgi:hypothetical protein
VKALLANGLARYPGVEAATLGAGLVVLVLTSGTARDELRTCRALGRREHGEYDVGRSYVDRVPAAEPSGREVSAERLARLRPVGRHCDFGSRSSGAA